MDNMVSCQCGTSLKVRPGSEGMIVRCPNCSRKVTVPHRTPQKIPTAQPVRTVQQIPTAQPVPTAQPLQQPTAYQPNAGYGAPLGGGMGFGAPLGAQPYGQQPYGYGQQGMHQSRQGSKAPLIILISALGGGALLLVVGVIVAVIMLAGSSDSDVALAPQNSSGANFAGMSNAQEDSDPFSESKGSNSTSPIAQTSESYAPKQESNGVTSVTRPGEGSNSTLVNTAPSKSSSSNAGIGSSSNSSNNSGFNQSSEDLPVLELADLIEVVEPSVVRIDYKGFEGGEKVEGLGSGFIADTDGRIVTNFHVIESAAEATVKLPDGSTFAVEGFITTSLESDLAVIKINPGTKVLKPIRLSSSAPRKGEKVAAFGSPLGFSFSATEGVVSANRSGQEVSDTLKQMGGGQDLYKELGYGLSTSWIQTSAAISGGNSGGPLVNMKGELVGVNTWSSTQGENLNFASSVDTVKLILSKATGLVQTFNKLPKPSQVGTSRGSSRRELLEALLLPGEKIEMASGDLGFTKGAGEFEVSRFDGLQKRIIDLAVSPDGKYMAACSKEGKTMVFDMDSGKALYSIATTNNHILRIGFSERPQLLCSFREGVLSESVSLRHPQDGKPAVGGIVMPQIGSEPTAFAVSPDARTVFTVWDDGNAWLYRIDALGESMKEFDLGKVARNARQIPHTAVFAPDGRFIVLGTKGGELVNWTGAGSSMHVVGRTEGHTGTVHCMSFSPDGKYLVSGGEDGKIYQWTNWDKNVKWRRSEFKTENNSEILDIHVSPSGTYIAAGFANNIVKVWDAKSKKEVREYTHGGPVTCVRFTQDGKFLITGGTDTIIRIFSLPKPGSASST